MNRKWVVSAVAAVAALVPFTAYAQVVAPESSSSSSAQTQASDETQAPAVVTRPQKYTAYIGFGYTSLNQVNQSRNGLAGFTLAASRDFGKYFAADAQVGNYTTTLTSSNPGNPTVTQFLFGPEIHAGLSDNMSIFFHGLFGGVHTGNVSISPSTAFAAGYGVGLNYKLSRDFGVRVQGDSIGSSFSPTPYVQGDATHTRFNAHATIGVFYKF